MLNDKQKRFCEEYMIDLNATQAAIRAGYSKKTAYSIAERLLRNVDIQGYLVDKRKKIADKLEISQERVLKELARIAFFDIRKVYDDNNVLVDVVKMDDDAAAVVSGIEVDEIYEGVGKDRAKIGNTVKLKLSNKVTALENLGKHLGLFEKDNDQKKPELTPFSNEQVDKLIDVLRKNKK